MTHVSVRAPSPRPSAKCWPERAFRCYLSNDYITTPAISYAVKQLGCAGGVMITSSHNPWNWNGVKFKAKYGGSGSPAIMKAIEAELYAGAMPKGSGGSIERVDFKPDYVAAITKFVDLDMIAAPASNSPSTACTAAGATFWRESSQAHGIRSPGDSQRA